MIRILVEFLIVMALMVAVTFVIPAILREVVQVVESNAATVTTKEYKLRVYTPETGVMFVDPGISESL